MPELIFLIFTSFFAGALNAVAGGGTFFAFPALLFTGAPSIAANATCTIALWPASLASMAGFRSVIDRSQLKNLPLMLLIALTGGWIGAELLLTMDAAQFDFLVPWLLLLATIFFAFGKTFANSVHYYVSKHSSFRWLRVMLSTILLIITSIYGGFFGAGIGILLLAMLYMIGIDDMHKMNGLKVILASAINASAFFTFILSDIVLWDVAPYMLVAGIAGGYTGAHCSIRLPQYYIRRFVLTVAITTTLYFFFDYYLL